MIPKIIHYCWFGRGKMPDLVLKCIESWKRYLPEYEIRLWNEDNFDINLYPFAAEAYAERKFAFVTDVCRLYVLREFGGIYLDSDVEILKPLDNFLNNHVAFSGFEDNDRLTTGLMGSEKNGLWVNELLKYYDHRSFYLKDGTIDITPNTEIITQIMEEKGLKIQNSLQEIKGYCTIYPSDYFCPKSWLTKEIYITPNTYCIHHFTGSWLPSKCKWNKNEFLLKLLGKKNFERLVAFYGRLKN